MREGDSTEEEEKKYAFGIYRILDSEKCNENLTKKYTPLKVKDGITGNLFVNKESDSPAWKEFVTDLSSTNTHNMTNTRWSFVFLYDVDANSYAFTGGSGHHEIKEFVDQTFGMELACRLIFPDTVKLIKQKSLVGELQQESKIYREYNYNFDVTNWQKITSNLVGEADKTDLEELFGKAVDSNRLVVEGGSFIKLKHALSMTELDKVLKRVSALMKKPPRLDLFKGFSPIHKENSKHLRKILLRELRA